MDWIPFKFVPRSEWGQGLDFGRGWRKRNEDPVILKPKGIVIHHFEPDSDHNQGDYDHCLNRIRHYFQVHSDMWCDIGYHFLVGTEGTVFQGRDFIDNDLICGAHTAGNNHDSIGVVLLGYYDTESPADIMMQSLYRVTAALCQHYAIDPMTAQNWNYLDRDLKSSYVTAPSIVAHRDVRETRCPGDRFYEEMPRIRAEIRQRITTSVKS